MKIFFISQKPFGLMGTPGTYYLVDSYGLQVDVRIVANDTSHQNIDIVYHPKNVKGLSRIKFGTRRYLHEIQSIVKEFNPQIVVVGNFLKWYEIVGHLKENCPAVKYILDIKTPLIVDEGTYNLLELQQINQSNGCHLDLIMAYSQEAIASWIPNYSGQKLIYPLGIKYNQFLKPKLSPGITPCRKFVYIGSLHSLRKLDLLLRYIKALPETIRKLLTVDFYGSGPETENLSSIIRECGSENTVFLRGCFDNHEIGGILAQYDAGLAWVPHKIYNNSPSLKLLEYMAQSIPGDQREELDSMLKLAGKLNIPTVFWFALDSQYHEHFVDFARRFDRVYCADLKGLELMAKDGVRAEILLPAAQPVIFNPIHNCNTISIQNTGIVYDGWYDLFKFPELNTVISKFKELNLNIIESAAMM